MIIDIILGTYIIGLVIFGGLFAIVTWKMGGFGNYATLTEKISGMRTTSNEIQWGLVILTLLWPITMWLLFQMKKG